MVTGATLFLTCGVDNQNLTNINVFTSRIKKSWHEENVTWYQVDNSTTWQLPGADGVADKGDWEPPFYGYGNNTFQINVTSIVQDAVINSRNSIEILVSATNGYYTCHMSESADVNSRPFLSIDHQLGSHSSGGMLTPNFIKDGTALMDKSEFLLTAATNPEITWDNMTGNHAEVQISDSPDFKSQLDDFWHFNSVVNSSLFTIGSTSGEMTIPAGNELTNSTTMYYRIRATDSTHTIGQWESGFFHLPGHTATQSGNYGIVSIDSDNLGLSDETFIETFVNSSSSQRNSNMGSDGNFTVGTSSSSEQYGLMRINLDDVGLHTNSSIIDATLELERIDFSGDAEVSIHAFYGEEWTENGATWRKYNGVNGWDDGGRIPSMSVGSFDGNQSSSNIEVNLTAIIQKWIDDNNAALASGLETSTKLELMLVASTFGIDSTTTNWVTICSSDALDCNGPSLSITYDWDSNGPPTIPTHTSPSDGAPVWNLTGHNLSGNTTPTLTWDGTISWSGDMLMQISTDMEYRNIIHSFNTATSTEFNSTDGTWSIPGNEALDEGVLYHWRLAQIDSTSKHHSWWSTSSFLVSGLESEHIQNDDHRLRLSHGNATTAGDAPSCEDTFIDSGSPSTNYNDEDEIQISYNTLPAETSVLIGCDLTSHMLPQGYAVKSATLKMRLASYPLGTPSIGAWESLQHNWSEDTATWATYDGTNAWGTSGAKGWEKSSLLDSVSITNSNVAGDWLEWDITLAVQNAMRENRSVDLILGIMDVGSGNNRDILLYPNSANPASRPEISFVYVPGSNALPSDPTPVLPLNGSWSVKQGINPEPDQNPQLAWNYTANSATIGGSGVELDTSPNFDSSNIIMVTSWNDVGFDVINQTYNVSTALDKGETWVLESACNQRYKSNRQLVKCIPLLIARYYNMEHRFKYSCS